MAKKASERSTKQEILAAYEEFAHGKVESVNDVPTESVLAKKEEKCSGNEALLTTVAGGAGRFCARIPCQRSFAGAIIG